MYSYLVHTLLQCKNKILIAKFHSTQNSNSIVANYYKTSQLINTNKRYCKSKKFTVNKSEKLYLHYLVKQQVAKL